jgi:inositol 2-dehydrogenase
MKKLGIGIVGVGEMGRRHAENIRRNVPNAKLVAIADVAEARAKQTAAELEVDLAYGSLDAMLANKDVEAVLIATPDKFHAPAVAAAARAGKHILCEKPLGLNLAEAQAALDAVAKAGVHLQMGFMRRYDPPYAAAMKRIEAGEIGTPVIFKSIGRDKDQPPMAAYESNVNGMIFYTNTIHDFDLARWMMQDEVANVHAFTTSTIRPEVAKYGDVVASVVNLQYRNGAIGNIESYAQAVYGYDVRTEVIGSKGSILVGAVEKTPAVFLASAGGHSILADHFLSRFADAYLEEVRDFATTILAGRAPVIDGQTGLKSLAIAVAAEESHKTGKPVAVKNS